MMKLFQSFFFLCFCTFCIFANGPELSLVSRTSVREYPPDQGSPLILGTISNNNIVRQGNTIVLPEFGAVSSSAGFCNGISGLDLERKSLIWEIFLPDPVFNWKQAGSSVLVSSGRLVTAIDIASGKIRWQYDGERIVHEGFRTESALRLQRSSDDIKQMGLCISPDGNRITILDFERKRLVVLDSQENITATVNLNPEISSALPAAFYTSFQSFNENYLITGKNLITVTAPDGSLLASFRCDSDGVIAYSFVPDGSREACLALAYDNQLVILDKDLKLLHKTKLPKSVDKLQDIERIGDDLLVYDSSTVYVCALDGTFKWLYRSSGKKVSFLVFSLPPMLFSRVLCPEANSSVYLIRFSDRVVLLDRTTGKQIGEYVYDPDLAISGMLDLFKLTFFPMFQGDGDRFFVLASGLKHYTDPGTFGVNHFKVTDYLYELRLR